MCQFLSRKTLFYQQKSHQKMPIVMPKCTPWRSNQEWGSICMDTVSTGDSLLIWTKNFYQQNPPGTLKVVWTLLNPTEFAQKIDLLLKVPDVAPSTAEKMTSLQMCWIKKIPPRTVQTFWDRQLCFYVKKLFVSEKTQKSEFFICHRRFMSSNFSLFKLEPMCPEQN